MVSLVKRKVILQGSNPQSATVSLPRPWYRYYEPREVTIYYEDVVLIVPPGIDELRKRRLITALKY